MKENCFKGGFCLKAGFTLIELLVVVLIIGILAAVAVPQYKKAVIKSKAGQMLSLVRSLAEAQKLYHLANGKYADTFEELEVSLPGNPTKGCSPSHLNMDSPECYTLNQEWEIQLSKDSEGNSHSVTAFSIPGSFKIVAYFDPNLILQYGNITCIAQYQNLALGRSICSSLGQTTGNENYFKL